MTEYQVPRHIAFILDGNGRWAKSKGMPRTYGHTVGAKNVETILRACSDLGVKYVTMYAFSTENWNRPSTEVEAIMKLLESYLKTCLDTAERNNMAVKVIGDVTKLSDSMQEKIRLLEKESANYDRIHFQVALNYGARDEILRAVRRLAEDLKDGSISVGDINEDCFSSYLDTKGIPDPDLLIRTSGEQRLSNYLLWQMAYTEFYFTEVPWPDFNEDELKKAIEVYQQRHRRFGGV